MKLQDAIRNVLREGKSLANVNLYDDGQNFYVRTANKITLNHFLFQNDFSEMDDDHDGIGLNILFSTI